MKRSVALLATLLIACSAATGCADSNPPEKEPGNEQEEKQEIAYEAPTVERYSNRIEIEGQWGVSFATGPEGYGIGDPFVMRFNGKYYLYPSTSDLDDGIKVFESDDLVHWTDKGYAVARSEKTVHGAYAPEVIYYGGYFYLCQSRSGKGHYIYRSESPTEGFRLISTTDGMAEGVLDNGNLGMGIDGSFYVSDQGKLYLLHTSTPAGLKYNEITDVNDIRTSTLGKTGVLGDANLRHWIEGPGIFRRGNFSYLTYTGNHVISKGYRIAYSYAEDLTDLSSFIQPKDNVTIMDTDDDHYGLGHSSNVNGPDLDSIYTAYHNLVGNGPSRRYNVDRYFASGSVLAANGNTHRPVAMPSLPTAGGYSDALTEKNGFVLGSAGSYFTAEYNFIPGEGQELFFGRGEREYRIRLSEGVLSLTRLSNGEQTELDSAPVSVPEERLCTVRVENGDGVGYIYLNGMRLLHYDATAAPGELGYTRREGVGYTAFTNEVFGTSDFEALKNFPTKFPATSYLKGEMRGFSIAGAKRVKGGVRVGEKESTVRIGDANSVHLKKNDWVKYAVDVGKKGTFSLMAEVTPDSAGSKLRITLGEQQLIAQIPAISTESEVMRVYLGDIEAEEGIAAMKVQVLSGEVKLILFESYERESGKVSLQNFRSLHGNTLYGEDETLVLDSKAGDAVAIWENSAVTDFYARFTLSFKAETGSDFGIMLRASHYSSYPSQPTQSWRGYYLKLGSSVVSLLRYDYGDFGAIAAERTDGIDFSGDGLHTVEITAQGNRITVVIDDSLELSAEDDYPFLAGGLGAYLASGTFYLLDLEYQTL